MTTNASGQALREALSAGAASLGIALTEDQNGLLLRYLSLLLAWNRKVNLTAITDPAEAVERHLLDALGAAGAVRDLDDVLDIGSGGGVPGIPLAIVNPGQRWFLVETVHKKAGFLKAAIAALALPNVRAIQARAEGMPLREKIPVCEGAISRAFRAPGDWFALARHYVRAPGYMIAMIGAGDPSAEPLASLPGAAFQTWEYRLPQSGIHRRILRVEVAPPSAPAPGMSCE